MHIAESDQILHHYKKFGMASVTVCLTTMTSCSTHSNFTNISQSYVMLQPPKHRKQVF